MPQLAPPSCRTVMCCGGAFCRILRVDATPKPRALLPFPELRGEVLHSCFFPFKRRKSPRAARRRAQLLCRGLAAGVATRCAHLNVIPHELARLPGALACDVCPHESNTMHGDRLSIARTRGT